MAIRMDGENENVTTIELTEAALRHIKLTEFRLGFYAGFLLASIVTALFFHAIQN
jgi:hypothetical protein